MTERQFIYDDYCHNGTPCPAKAALGINHDSQISYREHGGGIKDVLWVYDNKTAPRHDEDGDGILTESQARQAWHDAIEEVRGRVDPPADLSGPERVAEELGWSS